MNSESKGSSKKKISPSEILAGLALIVKIVEYAGKRVPGQNFKQLPAGSNWFGVANVTNRIWNWGDLLAYELS